MNSLERIKELRAVQQNEVDNNYENGDLWNNCEDAIYNLFTYGQESEPTKLYDEQGYEIGYQLENGNIVEPRGMRIDGIENY